MPGLKDFKKVASQLPETNKLQERLQEFFASLQNCDLLDGTRIIEVSLQPGANIVNHKLGRTLIGWVLVRNRSNSVIWDAQDTNTNRAKTLILHTSAATTVDLWVF